MSVSSIFVLLSETDQQNEIFNICKISFNKRYLLHTYISYTPIATVQKRNELTLAPPWTELTLNSTVAREMTIDSHVTRAPLHNFSYYYMIRIAGRVGGPSDKYAVSIAYKN